MVLKHYCDCILFTRYWENVKFQRNGNLPRYPKKDYGSIRNRVNHHGCPLNDVMKGIFFSGNCELGMGYLNSNNIPSSPFGDTRWMKPLHAFLPENGFNYYFADFYCTTNRRVHYVLIAITRGKTGEDMFCRRTLVPIDIYDNNFFIFRRANVQVAIV